MSMRVNSRLTMPCSPRNKSNAISFERKGFTIMATAANALPETNIVRFPMMSAIRPQRRRKHPVNKVVQALAAANHIRMKI